MLRLILLLSVATMAQPFCVLYYAGKDCWYYDFNLCRDAAEKQHGACMVNNNEPAPPQAAEPIRGSAFDGALWSGLVAAQPFIQSGHQEERAQETPEPEKSASGVKSPIEWAEGIISDTASDIHTLRSACAIYHREVYAKKKDGGFDPNEWLCLRKIQEGGK
jgi:hypothetical protein